MTNLVYLPETLFKATEAAGVRALISAGWVTCTVQLIDLVF